MKKLLILCLIILLGISNSFAQDQPDSTQVKIETLDGNVYHGTITEETDDFIILATKAGIIKIQKSTISRTQEVNPKKMRRDKIWGPNPQSTRYFWAPNGYGLKPGEAYCQNLMLFYNQFAVGITENISIGGGFIPAFLVFSPTPVWISPKVSIPLVENKFNLGIGGFFGTTLGHGGGEDFGLVYGAFTYGTRDYNITAGLGWGYMEDGFIDGPAFNIGGMARLGKKLYLLGELYVVNDNTGITSSLFTFGGRSMIKRNSVDYGILIVGDEGSTYALPWLGMTVPLSKK